VKSVGQSLLLVEWERKVRAPQSTMPANSRAPRGDGKCNRKHTADGRKAQVRVKWCGKSAPRLW